MKIDILFIDGLLPRDESISFLCYLLPLATVLEKNKYTFKIFNLTLLDNYSKNEFSEVILNTNSNIIGMTTNADNINYVIKISNYIKEINPKIKIILGGPEATFNDIEIANRSKCDFIIRGEGETSLIEIMNALKSDKNDFNDIGEITYRNDKNEIIRNSIKNKQQEIPINNYNILTNKKYWIIPKGISDKQFESFLGIIINSNAIFFSTGRGCPYQCTFCVEGSLKRKINLYNLENVREDLINYLNIINIHEIYITDDTFTTTPKRVIDICNIFNNVRNKIKFIWYCEGRVNVLAKHPELIDIMYNSGLRKLQIGIESGVQRILDIYNKRITIDEIKKVVAYCSKYEDLSIHGNIIIGNPFETDDEFQQTCEFVKELVILSKCNLNITTSFLTPYHGTPIRKNPEKFGFESFNDNLDLSRGFGGSSVICKPKDKSLNYIYSQRHSLEIQVNKSYYEYMFNLDKKEIDKRILRHNQGNKVNKNQSWERTYIKLRHFDILMNFKKLKSTVDLSENLYEINNLYPLKLWDIAFNKEIEGYEFMSFKGDSTILSDEIKTLLWNLSTGNYSLHQMYQLINNNGSNISMNEFIVFFTFLEENYYIILKKWRV
jgi:radical SAM superfamily enzyme YgiQ (UPF0313 family)